MIYGHKESAWIVQNVPHEKCSPWETDFISSVADQIDQGRTLSEKQRAVLGKMWDKYGEGAPGVVDTPPPAPSRRDDANIDDDIPF